MREPPSSRSTVTSSRAVRDWRDFLNCLSYCHGCGRFVLRRVRNGKRETWPAGWTPIHQPYRKDAIDAPVLLLACSDGCAMSVRAAMAAGPVLEPLSVSTHITMPAEMRQQMMDEFLRFVSDEIEAFREFLNQKAANDPPAATDKS